MPDERLDYLWRAFSWRITAHVPYWDYRQLRDELESFDDWCAAWSRRGEHHLAHGNPLLAALCFHWASFLFPHDQGQFRAALARMEVAFRTVEPNVPVRFEDVELPGYLLRPEGATALAVICPGGDSTKEEFYAFGREIARRGIAVYGFDGPGHGAVSLTHTMRADWEVVIRAVVDRWAPEFERIAVGGFSYGGLFSLRAAAEDDRIDAVFPCYSWYSPAGRYAKGHPVSQAGVRQYMGADPPSVQDRITLAGVLDRVNVPVLQLYGGEDLLSPAADALRIERELAGPCTTIVQSDAVHIGNNVWYETRALLADWLAATLQ
jgi:2,6-dihydroxypseudooxynicotine hydrolase